MKQQTININCKQSQNIVDCMLDLHNGMTQSFFDLDGIRRIFVHTCVSQHFVKDNPSKCDIGSVMHGPVLRKKKNFN